MFLYKVGFTQQGMYFSDEFNNNFNSWPIHSTPKMIAQIDKGFYNIKYWENDYSYRFWKPIFMDQNKDFFIESRIKQNAGNPKGLYGIVWGSGSVSNSYSFVISSFGFYKIYKYKNEVFQELKEATQSMYILPTGQFNTLGIRKQKDSLSFYINSQKVFAQKFQPFMGSQVGIVLHDSLSVSVDYINIIHPQIKINLVDSSAKISPKENIGNSINTQYSEIAPVCSPDGNVLFFARKGDPKNVSASFYDIWVSYRQSDNTWSKAENIGKPLNNGGDNLAIALTPDGNTLLVEGIYNGDGSFKTDAGISVSYKTKMGWTIPKEVKIKNFYNRNEYESYAPSVDRKTLVMSVERDDSYGSKDLYVSFAQNDGTYSEPKNLGSVINTYENEGTPFLAADNVTLYFYTWGKPGYGSADIFVTKRLDESWTRWSEPFNLGPSINSTSWDTYINMPASGDFAYLVSDQNSKGEEDIHRVKLSEKAKINPVVMVKGIVYDKKTGKPLSAKIIYELLENGKDIGLANSDSIKGAYKVALPCGKLYGMRAEAEGYFAISENFDVTDIKTYKEIEKNLYLSPIEVGLSVVLNNIFFDKGKAILRQESYTELDRIYELLINNPKIEVEISGHTEMGHSDSKLSQERANTVKEYLVKKGINANRITAIGFANKKPLSYDLKYDQMNRRVEFKITKS